MGLLDAPFGLLKGIVGEDTLAHIPVLNSITGSRSDATKQLDKKQQQLAKESEERMRQNAQTRMQALGQSMLAFNPQNQMMAQMFGPQAAFSPQQFAQMAQNPNGPPQLDPSLLNPDGSATSDSLTMFGAATTDKDKQAKIDAWYRAKKAYEAQQQMVQNGMQPVGPGPAPLQPQAPPQAARRF